ncbi:MAG: hypothetical protein KDB66_10655 [Solirubrobacterales bacterium]|nr:hypothetical protein [Solirubrobacterales bacterium]
MRAIATTLVAGLVLLAISPSPSNASGSASISGTLTSSNAPATDVCVGASNTSGETVKFGITDASGGYTLSGLEPGTYRIGFFTSDVRIDSFECRDANVLPEYFDNKSTLAAATPVAVADGSEVTGIDAELAKGGSISGRVSVGTRGPNGDICVQAYDSSGQSVKWTKTDSAGRYSLVGLATGNYRVEFGSCQEDGNVFGEFYPDEADLDHASSIPVTAGSDTPDIDANLARGGSISGTVLGEGSGTCWLFVDAYNSSGQVTEYSNWYSGSYKLNRLKPGKYRLKFDLACAGPPMLGSPVDHYVEYFNDQKSLATATPVSVKEGSETEKINVLLGQDGTISGTVTSNRGKLLDDVCVEAFDADGNPAGVIAHTTHGQYVIKALDSGYYRVKFSDCLEPDDPSVATEFYDDRGTLAEAVPVQVTRGTATTAIDAELRAKPKPPVARHAVIGRVSVKGPVRLNEGRKTIQRVRITNTGDGAANGVVLKVKGRGVRFRALVGPIRAGSTKVVRAGIRPRKSGRTKLTFRVTSSNAGRKSVRRVIAVRDRG